MELAPAEVPALPREEPGPAQSVPETITLSARSADQRVVGWTEVCPSPMHSGFNREHAEIVVQGTPEGICI